MKNYIPDTSVIIEKIVSKLIKKKEIGKSILIPNAVVAELEAQANRGQEIGLIGLDELQNLQNLSKQGIITLKFIGQRPNPNQIRYAKSGEIDALIRELAFNEDSILVTADKIQAESAKAYGIEVKFIETKPLKAKLEIESLFDSKTMSVHLKENSFAFAKKGFPGNWQLEKISSKKYTSQELQKIAKEIVEKSRIDPNAFIEISRPGSTIVQYKNYRIVIVKPPVSDGWEITAVKPLKVLSIEDYKLPEIIFDRIKNKARGMVVAGEVGSGKSTFCQSVAEFYANSGRITKTIESPRDLQLSDQITQYSKNFASSEELHDILFLSRPDNIIFDEMRDTPDFKLYADLRLAGSNVLGVLHSATPIDTIQRFIGRLETGMIPSILDTILFIEAGNIAKVLTIRIKVKVPTGMTEADLARPVVEIIDFKTNKLEYEIYSYGEETVVIPIAVEKSSAARSLAQKQLQQQIKKYSTNAIAEILTDDKAAVYVPEYEIAKIIGKQGRNIEQIEKELGISIDVREQKEYPERKKEISFEVFEKKEFVVFKLSTSFIGKLASIYCNKDYLFSATVGKKGEIKIHKKSELGRKLSDAVQKNKDFVIRI